MNADIFARRVFTVDGQDVACRFFRPQADRGDFYCLYEIDWPGGVHARKIYGVDEVQALLLAMQTAHADLLVARENDGRIVSWINGRKLGLPIADVVRDWDEEPDA